MKKLHLFLGLLGIILAAIITTVNPVAGFLLLFALGAALQVHGPRLAVTFSVPELLHEVLTSFKTQLFDFVGMTTNFKSDTARLNDQVIGKIAKLPIVNDYDAVTGWDNNATSAEDLVEDVPITLNRLKHVPVQIKLLTELGSKVDLIPKVEDMAFALVKYILDDFLSQAGTNVTHTSVIGGGALYLDTFENGVRSAANLQKMGSPRYAIINSTLATALGDDDKVGSSLYYGQKNGDQGYRRFQNLAGFKSIIEYSEFSAGANVCGLAFDPRLACLCVRKLTDMEQTARDLGIQSVMNFDSETDLDTGLNLSMISWQKPGSGDVILSCAALYGMHVGNGGGSALSKTDQAGLLLKTQ